MSAPEQVEPLDMIHNPPGLRAVSYAHGRHAALRQAMLDGIARDTGYLRDLNSRDPADPTIALIDSWAVAGEVLSFYAERIANEGSLQTATERRSLRALARLIDYELRPGKAAEAWLAFTLEDAPGAPLDVPIPVGTRAQSIPGPGETMVTFETVEAITGHPHLSAMRPRMDRDQTLQDVADANAALCQGVITDVRRGDWLLLVRGTGKDLFRAENVTADAPAQTTRISFTAQPVNPFIFLPVLMTFYPLTTSFAGHALAPALVTGEIAGKRRKQVAIESEFRSARIDTHKLALHLNLRRFLLPVFPSPQGLFHFKVRAAVFGHNVPNEAAAGATPSPAPPTLAVGATSIKLDAEYPELRPGSWIAFNRTAGAPFITKVTSVDTVSARVGKLTARVTQVGLQSGLPSGWAISSANVTVLADSRDLPLAPIPVSEDVAGSELRLDRYLPDLLPGRPVAVTGERSDLPGVVESEVHVIGDVELDDGRSVVTLASSIVGPFARGTVRVNANVALATHGESGGQPIGHGDGASANQSFTLPVSPLTHIGAANPKGLAAALVIRVDGLLWTEVPSLRDAGPNDRVYQLRYGEDGSVRVVFGGGVNGRRLPSGVNNVVAWWRKGLGREGMVRAEQLSLLSGAPQGVKAVTNPLPATGAADSETLEEARANAPLSVMTLDRIVTLGDYEDFARAFGGIAKAQAVWSWNGTSRAITLTVAGVAGDVPAQRDIDNLRAAIAKASDQAIALTILPYRPATFRVAAAIRIDPAFVPDAVKAAVAAALADAFSFDRRSLGQPVYRSEVIATLQAVPGIDWIDLDALYRGEMAALAETLFAEAPRSGVRFAPIAAELLSLHPAGPDLVVTA
ncbi:MAG: putative baseplate assembly protein [Sphingomonas sp.]|uniref:putative baseplate assembly protein n=1 Tax=Sphingomonas sp. TaxID=28214 RepID=UPI001B1A1266|nr:putative baseplate assembly protein [Sphingomonas sp.]MBO9621253.1 putative baseplate assembly protein [Sphingomonas sp.]